MLNTYYYVKNSLGYGMDKYGRFTDNVSCWEIHTDKQKALKIAASYGQGVTIGIL